MRSRLPLAALLLLAAPLLGRAAPAPAAGKSSGPPVVLQVAPIDKVLADVRGMVRTVAGDGFVGMVDNAVNGKLGDKGWAGLDTKKPAAGYVYLPNKALKGPEDFKEITGFLALPITTEDEFKALPERLFPDDPLTFKPVDGKKGLYAVETRNGEGAVPVRLRFHDGYAYIGINAKDDQLDAAALVSVADLVKANDPGLVLVRVFTDRYPEELLKQQSQQFDELLAKLKEEGGGRVGWMEGILESYVAVIKRSSATMTDTEESGFRLAFDEKAAEVAIETYAVPKKGTAYAKELAAVKPTANRFASLVTDKSPAAVLLQLPIGTPELRDLFTKALDAGAKAKENAPEDVRPVVDELLKGLTRTVKGDAIDFAVAINPGKDGHYTGVVAVTFDDATKLEKAIKDAVKQAPKPEQERIQFDAEKVDGVNVHRITPPDVPEPFKNLFGSTDFFVAFGPKGIYAAVGIDALGSLKSAMTAKPAAAKVVDVVVNPKQLGDLIGTGNEQAGKMAAQALGTEDTRLSAFSISYEGGPTMKVRTALNLKVIPKAVMMFGMGRAAAAPPAK